MSFTSLSIKSLSTKSISTLCAGLIASLLCVGANANLIVNGGFEGNTVASGNWGYFAAADVNGWEGDNLEIWNQMGGVIAPEGQQHAELNAHPFDGTVFSIYQNFATVIGQTYDVSFFYSARIDDNEKFSFSAGSLSALLDDHVVGSWNQYTGSFVATSGLSSITFTSFDAGTLGNFIDDIVVVAKANVAESSPLVMLLIGLCSLVLVRKKQRV